MGTRRELPNADQLVALIEDHGSIVAVGRHLGVPDQTIHAHMRRLERDGHANIRARVRGATNLSRAHDNHPTRHNWPRREELAELIRKAPSFAAAAEGLGVAAPTLRHRCKRLGLDPKAIRAKDKTTVTGDTAVLEGSELADAKELASSRGFDLAEWDIVSAVVNEWGIANAETGEPYRQLKLTLKRKASTLDWVFPAADPKQLSPWPKARKTSSKQPYTYLVTGDHQAPYHHTGATAAQLRWLADQRVKVDEGIHLGDLIDLPTPSTHAPNPAFNASAQECVNAGHLILRDLVTVSRAKKGAGAVPWTFMAGNHDARVRLYALRQAAATWSLRPADIPGEDQANDALSLRHLLRLDQLGVTCEDSLAGYQHNRVRIGNDFEIRHGMFTGGGAGGPARKTMDSLNASIAVGHTHAKSHVFRAHLDKDRVSTIRQAAEAGTMCANNLGYNAPSDWHLGWLTVTLFPDTGLTTIDHAVYHENKGVVTWRGQQF